MERRVIVVIKYKVNFGTKSLICYTVQPLSYYKVLPLSYYKAKTRYTYFDILLTVHLNIFILMLTNLMY